MLKLSRFTKFLWTRDIPEQALEYNDGEGTLQFRPQTLQQYGITIQDGVEFYWNLPNPFKGNKVRFNVPYAISYIKRCFEKVGLHS